MSWWETIPTFLVALGFGVLPGLILALLLGLRGMALLGSAPAFSITSIALASIVAPMIGLSWGLLPVVLTTALLAAVITGFRILWYRIRPHAPIAQDSPRLLLWAGIGVAFAAAVIAIRFIVIFGNPENISQTYDNIFHLNALRFVLDTGNASSLTLGGLPIDAPATGAFYPAVWHALVTLVVEATGTALPVVVNIVSILMGAIYWPLGCVFLIRQIAGPRALALVAAGGLAAAFGAFPYLMVDFGVLYPYLLGVSLLPAALAYLIAATRLSVQPVIRPSRARFALLGVLPGIALAHPGVVMALIALSTPLLAFLIYREYLRLRRDHASRRRFTLLYAASAIAFIVLAALWLNLRVRITWIASLSLAQSIGEALLNAPTGLPVSVLVTVCMGVGLWVAAQNRTHPWLIGSLAIAMCLYVVAAGVPPSPLRSAMVGVWYGDSYRLAAVLPVVVLPFAVIGLVAIHDTLLEKLRLNDADSRNRRRRLSSLVVALALVTSQGASVQAATSDATESYLLSDEADLLTPDELDVLNNVANYVPADAIIAGNPWTGASLVYAISNRRAMLPHVGGFDTEDSKNLAMNLRRAQTDPTVCASAEALDVRYVLDFGSKEIHNDYHDFWGFTRLSSTSAVTPVYQKGDVGLYEITACE